jgi:guanylate kinase
MQKKLIILSAPSGAGKTSIVKRLLQKHAHLSFSISAASREARINEVNGVDYYFLGKEGFEQKISENAFLEWEEVYPGQYYGTLRSEVERLWSEGKTVVFDIDVVGALNLKKQFGNNALALFVKAPSIEVLHQRLRSRNTESEEKIAMRISKAETESAKATAFDAVVINDNLDTAIAETEALIASFLNTKA